MNQAFLRKIKRNDTIARWVITGGGMAIISSVILILVLIVKVSLPLFYSPGKELTASFQLHKDGAEKFLAVGMDEYLETGYVIDQAGHFKFFDLKNGQQLDTLSVTSESGAKSLVSVQR